MLQQGVIDGVFLPMMDQKGLRLSEVAPYVTVLPTGLYQGSFSMFINPDFIASLDQRDAEAIMSISGEKLSAQAGHAWSMADKEGLSTARQAGVSLNMLTKTDLMAVEFEKITEGLDEAWIKQAQSNGVDAKKALQFLRKTANEYSNNE